MRVCIKCNIAKNETEFLKHLSRRDGLASDCRECRNKYNRAYRKLRRATDEVYRQKCNKSVWPLRRAKKYNITPAQYNQMLASQNGVCKICGGVNKDGRPLFIDHNHVTTKIRGLLCLNCNCAIGWIRDSSKTLRLAADYLDSYN